MTDINISIPAPCHEDWGKMSPADKGRFCQSCSKVVRDFTNESQEAIYQAYQEAKGQLCGRFRETQITAQPAPIRPFSWIKRFVLALMLAFGAHLFVFAQSPGIDDSLTPREALWLEVEPENTTVFSFTVKEATTGEAIAGAKVKLVGAIADTKWTNALGMARIAITKREIWRLPLLVKVTAEGYPAQELVVDLQKADWLIEMGAITAKSVPGSTGESPVVVFQEVDFTEPTVSQVVFPDNLTGIVSIRSATASPADTLTPQQRTHFSEAALRNDLEGPAAEEANPSDRNTHPKATMAEQDQSNIKLVEEGTPDVKLPGDTQGQSNGSSLVNEGAPMQGRSSSDSTTTQSYEEEKARFEADPRLKILLQTMGKMRVTLAEESTENADQCARVKGEIKVAPMTESDSTSSSQSNTLQELEVIERQVPREETIYLGKPSVNHTERETSPTRLPNTLPNSISTNSEQQSP